MIEFGPDICNDVTEASSREWLETNGIGGYSSGTIAGINTRRYHGLLIAASDPPLGRVLLLSKLEETLVIDGERFELSANQYPGAVQPRGFEFLRSFKLDPFPVWTFSIHGLELEKRICMPHGDNSVAVTWRLLGEYPDAKVSFEVRPLLAFRDHHHLRTTYGGFDTTFAASPGRAEFKPDPALPALFLNGNFTDTSETGSWYRNFEYAIEKERGFDYVEDLYQPCVLMFHLNPAAEIIASVEPVDQTTSEIERAELRRRAMVVARANDAASPVQELALAADQFIVQRGTGKTVIAGYPWFSDWGRDTMIALPGLALATNRPEIAKSIIAEFSKHISEGMIPNRFPDVGETPEYNTVDATLWYFEAIRAYVAATGDLSFVRDELYDKLVDIIDRHVSGTRYGIKLDDDGLLMAGEPGTQLTWMDAKIGDRVITPRTGKPVEIQALWYNALMIMGDLADKFGDVQGAEHDRTLAARARFSFEPTFWNEEEQCLYDVSCRGEKDPAIRPNQIFAASLHHAIAEGDLARGIVDKVEAELLTPYGLRSLSPRDPNYVGIYTGSPEKRDSSYHQGTVWGWLIGPFVDAYIKTRSETEAAGLDIDRFTRPLEEHLAHSAMTGQISEIFDGDAPHTPRGCPAQAWSVAEVLRIARTNT